MTFEEKKEAELMAKKEKREKNQKLLELGLVALRTYAAQIDAGETTADAMSNTMSSMTVLKKFVGTIASYFVGTDYVEGVDKTITGKGVNGGHMAEIHEGEMIFSNKEVKDMNNIGIYTRDSALKSMKKNDTKIIVQNNDQLITEIQSLKSIIDSKPVITDVTLDKLNNAIVYTMETKNKKINNHKPLKI